jgi:hypothetical protein
MLVLDSFTEPAPGKAMNEDAWLVTNDLAAVIDGAGDIHGRTYRGKTWGRLATDCLVGAVRLLSPSSVAHEAFLELHHALQTMSADLPPDMQKGSTPAASIVIYNQVQRQVWRVGDANFSLDGDDHTVRTAFDDIQVELKRLIFEAVAYDNPDQLRPDEDLDLILRLLHNYQPGLQNPSQPGPYALSILDGHRPPLRVEQFSVPQDASLLILASDGYPRLFPTLQEAERFLYELRAQDPLLTGKFAQAKLPRQPGAWDDRTYLKLDISSKSEGQPHKS